MQESNYTYLYNKICCIHSEAALNYMNRYVYTHHICLKHIYIAALSNDKTPPWQMIMDFALIVDKLTVTSLFKNSNISGQFISIWYETLSDVFAHLYPAYIFR